MRAMIQRVTRCHASFIAANFVFQGRGSELGFYFSPSVLVSERYSKPGGNNSRVSCEEDPCETVIEGIYLLMGKIRSATKSVADSETNSG